VFERETAGETYKRKATDAFAPAPQLLVNDRVGAEQEVQSSIDDGQIDTQEEDNRLAEKKDPRTRQSRSEGLS
jgi:hypothetical protein